MKRSKRPHHKIHTSRSGKTPKTYDFFKINLKYLIFILITKYLTRNNLPGLSPCLQVAGKTRLEVEFLSDRRSSVQRGKGNEGRKGGRGMGHG